MNCRQAQDWLLSAEDPRPVRCGVPEVARHLAGCAACRRFAAELQQLEQAWRDLPVPAAAEPARQAFLERLTPRPVPAARPLRLRRFLAPRWVAAALILLTLGLVSWAVLRPRPAPAAPELVEQLVAWNLDLTQAATPAERERIYTARADALRAELRKPNLPKRARDLAEMLLENGRWLAANEDPVAAADRFNEVAERLVDQINTAADDGDFTAVDRVAGLYGQVEQGVAANLEKAETAAQDNPEQQQKLGSAAERRQRSSQALEAVVQRAPPAARAMLQKKLEKAAKGHKHKGGRGRH